jgi:PAS domain S-box-containing protein
MQPQDAAQPQGQFHIRQLGIDTILVLCLFTIITALMWIELEGSVHHFHINYAPIIPTICLMGLGGIWLVVRGIGTKATALMTERDHLKSVFNAAPMPMLLVDERMEVVRVNSALREYCTDYDALPDRRCGTILKCVNALSEQRCGNSPECDPCGLLRALRKVLSSGQAAHGETTVQQTSRGEAAEKAWVLYGVEELTFDGRRHALVSFMDITRRKRMEEALAAREQEFRALVENSPDSIARYDRLCRRVYVNPALERVAGKSADRLTGRTPAEASVSTPEVGRQVQVAVEQVLKRGVPAEIELSWEDSNRVTLHFLSRFVPEFDPEGNVASVLNITRDITSLRKTEAQLQHAQKMESIGTLAGGVAHDFNNILTVIVGYSELLQISLKGDERRLGFVQEIFASVNRGAELTRSLLTFSGKREQQKQFDDLNQIVVNLQKSMSRLLRSDITLNFTLCADLLPVFADRVQIEQVLINLMVNARDALTADGQIEVTTRLVDVKQEIVTGGTTLSPGSYGLVTVTDNGEGMNEETLGRIFEPFFTTKELGKGTGLGLAIVFGIVGNHNGHVTVESIPGKGSVFGVYIPIHKGPRQPKIAPEPETASGHGNETILLADDDPIILKMTREILMHSGYTVLTASDGVEALEVFAAHRDEIRMVVTDLIMPRMNGRETITQIRKEKQDLPVILVSGHTFEIIDLAAMENLNIVFMPKPVNFQKLLAMIRTVLDSSC